MSGRTYTLICDTCNRPFHGKVWMKECPGCYKSGGPSDTSKVTAFHAERGRIGMLCVDCGAPTEFRTRCGDCTSAVFAKYYATHEMAVS